jgi:hypothetical protein
MKVLKFNENISNRNWTIEKVKTFCGDYKLFVNIARDYIIWKNEYDYDENDDEVEVYINSILFIEGVLNIEYNDQSGNDLEFEVEDLKEFTDFLNNPDLVKNMKKYNL